MAAVLLMKRKKETHLETKGKSHPSSAPVQAPTVTSPICKLHLAPPDTPTTTTLHNYPFQVNVVTIAAIPHILILDSEAVSSQDSQPQDITDSE